MQYFTSIFSSPSHKLVDGSQGSSKLDVHPVKEKQEPPITEELNNQRRVFKKMAPQEGEKSEKF